MGVINLTFYSQKLWHSDKPFPVKPDPMPYLKGLDWEASVKTWLSTAYEVVNSEVIPGISNALMTDDLRLFCEQDKVYKYLSDGDQITLPDGYGIEKQYLASHMASGGSFLEVGKFLHEKHSKTPGYATKIVATITLPEKPENSAHGAPDQQDFETEEDFFKACRKRRVVEPSESHEETMAELHLKGCELAYSEGWNEAIDAVNKWALSMWGANEHSIFNELQKLRK